MPARHLPDPPDLPHVLTRRQAMAAGLSSDQIRQRVRSGEWVAVASATYRRRRASEGLNDRDMDFRARAIGAALHVPESVIVGASAARVHGFPLVTDVGKCVELAVPEGAWRGERAGVRRRRLRLDPTDVMTRDYRITSPARTWVDVARELSLADALSVGDAALRQGFVAPDDLTQVLMRTGAIRGRRRAQLALPHLDARRESPLESWSWADFMAWGLPLPELQVLIRDDWGDPFARVDFLWREWRVIGEADGLLKYGPEAGGVGAFGREKDREARLRDLGFEVVRWRWADLASRPQVVKQRIQNALARAGCPLA